MNFYGLIRLVDSSPEGLTEDFGDYLTWSEYMTGQVPGQGFEQAMMFYISDLLQYFFKSFRQSLITILKMPLGASYSFLGNLMCD